MDHNQATANTRKRKNAEGTAVSLKKSKHDDTDDEYNEADLNSMCVEAFANFSTTNRTLHGLKEIVQQHSQTLLTAIRHWADADTIRRGSATFDDNTDPFLNPLTLDPNYTDHALKRMGFATQQVKKLRAQVQQQNVKPTASKQTNQQGHSTKPAGNLPIAPSLDVEESGVEHGQETNGHDSNNNALLQVEKQNDASDIAQAIRDDVETDAPDLGESLSLPAEEANTPLDILPVVHDNINAHVPDQTIRFGKVSSTNLDQVNQTTGATDTVERPPTNRIRPTRAQADLESELDSDRAGIQSTLRGMVDYMLCQPWLRIENEKRMKNAVECLRKTGMLDDWSLDKCIERLRKLAMKSIVCDQTTESRTTSYDAVLEGVRRSVAHVSTREILNGIYAHSASIRVFLTAASIESEKEPCSEQRVRQWWSSTAQMFWDLGHQESSVDALAMNLRAEAGQSGQIMELINDFGHGLIVILPESLSLKAVMKPDFDDGVFAALRCYLGQCPQARQLRDIRNATQFLGKQIVDHGELAPIKRGIHLMHYMLGQSMPDLSFGVQLKQTCFYDKYMVLPHDLNSLVRFDVPLTEPIMHALTEYLRFDARQPSPRLFVYPAETMQVKQHSVIPGKENKSEHQVILPILFTEPDPIGLVADDEPEPTHWIVLKIDWASNNVTIYDPMCILSTRDEIFEGYLARALKAVNGFRPEGCTEGKLQRSLPEIEQVRNHCDSGIAALRIIEGLLNGRQDEAYDIVTSRLNFASLLIEMNWKDFHLKPMNE